MIRIDDVITAIPAMTEAKRATWAANAARVIAKGPRRNPAHADALRLRDALAAFRGFDGDRLVARITRVRPGKFVVQVRGAALPRPYATLSAARAAAAEALFAGVEDAPAALPRAA